jgi:Flp pilus assembly protein TadG
VRYDDSGAVAIVVALFALVLFGFAALVVDVGNASDVRAQASAAADAGALAGESELAGWANANGVAPDPSLFQTVKDAVAATYSVSDAAWTACADTVQPGFTASAQTSCVQYMVSVDAAGAVSGTTVRVRIPVRKVPSTFGGVFGTNSISVSPVAAADAGQPAASPCQPCDPRLDAASGQPVSLETLPAAPPSDIRSELPDPASVPPAPALDAQGCPTGPGLFDIDVAITGACDLPAGLYVFDDSELSVQGSVSSTQAPDGTGVTLVFYGTAPQPLDVVGSLDLVATPAGQFASAGSPIPGVAIVIDQFDTSIHQDRSFDLGASFDITGSVYALDGSTTWTTADGDCPSSAMCRIRDDGDKAVIAVTKTSFATLDGAPVTPSVGADHPAILPSPEPEHLSE